MTATELRALFAQKAILTVVMTGNDVEEVASALEDRERMDWLLASAVDSHVADWIWDDASRLCPVDWEEAENTAKWGRAAIDAAMKEGK